MVRPDSSESVSQNFRFRFHKIPYRPTSVRFIARSSNRFDCVFSMTLFRDRFRDTAIFQIHRRRLTMEHTEGSIYLNANLRDRRASGALNRFLAIERLRLFQSRPFSSRSTRKISDHSSKKCRLTSSHNSNFFSDSEDY